MKESKIMFKGSLGGLKIHIDPRVGIDDVIDEIKQKLDLNQSFFDDTEVDLLFTGKDLSPEEKRELLDSLLPYVNIGSIGFNRLWDKKGKEAKTEKVGPMSPSSHEGMTRFFRGTLRNGQRIDYQGNIIVMGDVNPGAEIVAGGNVIVLGNLRGMAHAGAKGDLKAIVIALCLQPTQLRIGNIITRSPEGDSGKPSYPEIAYVKGDILLIEPYDSGNLKL